MKNINIIGGGTVSYVRNHLALCAPAYGTTANKLVDLCRKKVEGGTYSIHKYLTKMADSNSKLETNEDVSKLVDKLVAAKETRIIFFNPALVDFDGTVLVDGLAPSLSGKYETRLKTSEGEKHMVLKPTNKILGKIRKERKDIFLVAFKTTCGATEDEQFLSGLHLLKTNSCNLVLANDTKTRVSMIITPEQARYSVSTDREKVLNDLVAMSVSRAEGTFTRSTIVPGESIPWDREAIPSSLKKVVDYCIGKGAYKAFNGSTVGHFAFKIDNNRFITSKRKVNFNNLPTVGMVMCETKGDNEVIAHGFKPSVGGMSQRIIFKDHPGMDCIVHFHVPPRPESKLSVRQQWANECGSHQCGQNTSDGLREEFLGVKVVYLDNHGPNIVFNKKVNPQDIISFIDENFDLSKSTDQIDRNKVTV